MSIPQTVTLLEFYFKNTYFLFQGKYNKQVHGVAMGSPISPSLLTCSWKSLKSEPSMLPPTSSSMAHVCRQHLHYPTGRKQSLTHLTHYFTGPTHLIHYGGLKSGWYLTLLGYYAFPRPRHHFYNYSV